MSRRPPVVLILALGTACVWSLAALAFEGAEFASTSAADVDVLRAYIDPGVAGFVIVTVLGFISSIGYWARSYIGRVKGRLFGRGNDDHADNAHGEAPPGGNADGGIRTDGNADGERANC